MTTLDYKTYSDMAREGAALTEAGDHRAAIDIFVSLVNSEISDLDKANMCNNVAVCCDKLKQTEQALAWYEEGCNYERPYFRCYLAEMKAVYLSNLGRTAECIAIYEELLPQAFLLEHDKERIWNNLMILKNPRRP